MKKKREKMKEKKGFKLNKFFFNHIFFLQEMKKILNYFNYILSFFLFYIINHRSVLFFFLYYCSYFPRFKDSLKN